MARDYDDVRITYSGNVELARQYVSEARKYLGGLKDANSTNSAYRHITNSDGVRFFVANYVGQKQIEIWAPGEDTSDKRPKYQQGFMLAPRNNSLYGYSAQPFTLLIPTNGESWKSIFKTIPTPITGATHPTSAFTGSLLAYKDVFGTAPATNFAAARPSATNNRHQYWKNSDSTLYVQYDGVSYCGGSRPTSGNKIIVNGQAVVEPGVFASIIQALYPGNGAINLLGAAAQRTATGLRIYAVSQVSVDAFSATQKLAAVFFDIVPTDEALVALNKLNLNTAVNGYAPVYKPATAIDSPATLIAEYEFTSVQTLAAHSSFAFSPNLTEGRTFVWPKNAGVTVIREIVLNLQPDAEAFTVETENALPTATTTDTTDYGTYVQAFLVSSGGSYVNYVPVGGSERLLSRPAVAKYKCMVDYHAAGYPVYGYAKQGNRTLTDNKSMTFTFSDDYFYSLSGQRVSMKHYDIASTHLYDYDDTNVQLEFEFPKYNALGEEIAENWLTTTSAINEQSFTDSGTWNWRVQRDSYPSGSFYIVHFVRNQTSVTDNKTTTGSLSYLDLKTQSAIFNNYVERTVTTVVRTWTARPDLYMTAGNGSEYQIPEYPSTVTTTAITRTFQKKVTIAGEPVYDSGIISLRNFSSTGSPVVGSVISPSDNLAWSWFTTNNYISAQPGDTSNTNTSEIAAPSADSASGFSLNLERDWVAITSGKFLCTGVLPYPTNISTGAIAYNPISVSNFGIGALSLTDYMLGAHNATRFTPPMYISRYISSTE